MARLIAKVLPVFLILLPAVFLILAVVNFEKGKRKNLTAKQKLKFLIIGLIVTGVVTGIAFLLYAGSSYLNSDTGASVKLTLNYENASKGQNPNGTKFNPSSIISNEILEKAIAKGGFNTDAATLKSALSIKTSLPGNVYESKEDYQIVTQYELCFSGKDGLGHLDPQTVVNTIAEVYKEEFGTKFADNYEVLNMDVTPLEDLDYMDQVEYLDKEAEKIRQYMFYCRQTGNSFTGSNGMTFESIQNQIENIQNVMVEDINSYILTYGLSKNNSRYISRLNYENKLLDVDHMKNISSYNISLDSISKYDEEMARIVLVPTEDEIGEFYMSQTKIGVDTFAEDAEVYLKEASKLQLEAENNSYTITKMNESTGTDENHSKVKSMIETLRNNLEKIEEQAMSLAKEFRQKKVMNFITLAATETSVFDMVNVRMSALYSALCMVTAVLWSCSLTRVNGTSKNKRRKQK